MAVKESFSKTMTPGAAPRLAALAILKENWNDNRSYLDNFVPFVVEVVRSTTGAITVDEVRLELRQRFGMRMPIAAASTIVSRVVKRGYATRADHQIVPDTAALAGVRIVDRKDDLLRCHLALVEQLCGFAGARYGKSLSEDEAEALLDAHVDEHSVPIALRLEPDLDLDATERSLTDEYIVSAFVDHLRRSEPQAFNYLLDVVKGSMLASALYFPGTGEENRRFKDTTVFFDTRFLLRVIGLADPDLVAPARELVDLLRSEGVGRACFKNTVTEMRGVLTGAVAGLTGTGYVSEVARYFITSGMKRADIELLVSQLEKKLESCHVKVVDRPVYTESLGVDEVDLEAVLREEVHYVRDGQVQHDLDCLTAVHRLRRGQASAYIEYSRAIFVTTNDGVIRSGRRFFRTNSQGFNWPVAIRDRDLATIVWLKRPMQAPDLPRKQIIADCYAVLHPEPALWNRYLDEIERLAKSGAVSDDDVAIMRYSPEAQRALMDVTLGDPATLSHRTVAEVLEVAREAMKAPVLAELEAERDHRNHAERELDAQREVAEREGQRRIDAEMAQDVAERAIERIDARERVRCASRAGRWARRLGNAVFTVMMVVVAAGVIVGTLGFFNLPRHIPGMVRVGAWLLALVGILAALASAGWGVHVRMIVDKIEAKLAPWIEKRLLNRRSFDDHDVPSRADSS